MSYIPVQGQKMLGRCPIPQEIWWSWFHVPISFPLTRGNSSSHFSSEPLPPVFSCQPGSVGDALLQFSSRSSHKLMEEALAPPQGEREEENFKEGEEEKWNGLWINHKICIENGSGFFCSLGWASPAAGLEVIKDPEGWQWMWWGMCWGLQPSKSFQKWSSDFALAPDLPCKLPTLAANPLNKNQEQMYVKSGVEGLKMHWGHFFFFSAQGFLALKVSDHHL